MLHALEAVCDEIDRNGLTEIILLVSRSDDRFLAPLFVQTLLEKPENCTVYLAQSYWDPGFADLRDTLLEAAAGHLGGGRETSMMRYGHPDLVKMDKIDQSLGKPLGRPSHSKGSSPDQRLPSASMATSPINALVLRARSHRRRESSSWSTSGEASLRP